MTACVAGVGAGVDAGAGVGAGVDAGAGVGAGVDAGAGVGAGAGAGCAALSLFCFLKASRMASLLEFPLTLYWISFLFFASL